MREADQFGANCQKPSISRFLHRPNPIFFIDSSEVKQYVTARCVTVAIVCPSAGAFFTLRL